MTDGNDIYILFYFYYFGKPRKGKICGKAKPEKKIVKKSSKEKWEIRERRADVRNKCKERTNKELKKKNEMIERRNTFFIRSFLQFQ